MKRLASCACGILTVAASAVGQYSPPAGAGDILDYFSPHLLAGGPRMTSAQSPVSDALNPAASAAVQRGKLDLSYIGIADFAGTEQGLGSAINLGVTIPTRAGVLAASAHYAASGFNALNIGPLASLHASFAKDIFPNFYVGAGLQTQLGGIDGTFAWGLAADLGVLHRVGDVGFLRDLRWGAAIRGLGKGFQPTGATATAYPADFTPALGAAARLIDTDAVTLATSLDLTFPTFGDVRADIGLELGIADVFFLRGSVPLSAVELTQGSARTPITFGATVKFQTDLPEDTQLLGIGERGWARSEVQTHAHVTPIRGDLWATGLGANISLGVIDREPPAVEFEPDQVHYRSPNFDGVQDDLDLPLAITDRRYVMGYRLVIEDDAGNQVREIRNKDDRPENRGFQKLIDRLLYVDTGIAVPESVRWDGTGDDGAPVADGTYRYYLEAWDDNANLATTATSTVVVDTMPPAVDAAATDLIFSPNDDGNKDTLPIAQSGSSEDRWEAEVTAQDGTVIATFAWAEASPPAFEWDGRATDGTLAPDGVYRYRIASVDRAGNRTETGITNIIIDTQATPISVSIDDGVFSPNGDGEQDTVTYTLAVPVRRGVQRWSFALRNEAGSTVRTFSGGDEVPDFLRFDGLTDAGAPVGEGSYSAELRLEYANGNRPSAEPPLVEVDLTTPSAAVRANLTLFSPNGDGNKDVVTVFQETSEEVLWTATIRDADGVAVRTDTWRGLAEGRFEWDGRGEDGLLVADGNYRYQLVATDRAGNTGFSNAVEVGLDMAETPVFLTTDATHFSPNGDGDLDRLAILPRLQETGGIERYSLSVYAGQPPTVADPPVRSFAGRGGVPPEVVWDGLSDSGERVADGSYFATLDVLYAKGNNPVVSGGAFELDTVYPTATVTAPFTLFSPDGDGKKDVLVIEQSSSEETLWEAAIVDADGEQIRSIFWKGRLTDLEWDGNDENGNVVADGVYRYEVRSRDAAGNEAAAVVDRISVDSRRTPLFATVSADGFSPNGDGFRDELSIRVVAPLKDGLQSWQVRLHHAERGLQRTFEGEGAPPERLAWDGRRAGGRRAPDGVYTADVGLSYAKGNEPTATTSSFRLDVTPPRISLDISPRPFSPDNDGLDDELQIGVTVDEMSPIEAWNLQIVDPVGNPFTEFTGRGTPRPTITWNGLSRDGELVQAAEDYPVAIAMRDDLGNEAVASGVIPVDVLVIQEGDKLMIRISSITFPGNSADLDAVADIAADEKNRRTIDRLSEIFTKYSRYTIRIEGHANNLSFANPTAAAREQEDELVPLSTARSEAVKAALVQLGLESWRISTVGLGGSIPVVPFGDLENRWKNRRVEFVLTSR